MQDDVLTGIPEPKRAKGSAAARSVGGPAGSRSKPGPRALLCLAVTILVTLTAFSAVAVHAVPASDVGPQAGIAPQTAHALAGTNATLKANAGPDQTVYQGQWIYLNGSASTGPITSWNWTFMYVAENGTRQNGTLRGEVPARFSLKVPGVYNFTLNVTDGKGNYSEDICKVTVNKKPFNFLATYWQLMLVVGIVAFVVGFIYAAMTGRIAAVSESTREKIRLFTKRWGKIASQTLHNPMGLIGVVILVFFIGMAIFGPYVAPYSVNQHVKSPFKGLLRPSAQHWLGTDDLQLDIWSELLNGARTSMIVGIVSSIIASGLGALVGLYSGYVGGWKDEAIMRANDVVLSIPWLVLMIVVAALMGTIDLTGIILIIGLTGWSTTARMVRAQVLSLKERQFVERAKAIGASDMSIIRRHILPNAFPLVFANTILTVAVSILSEATLSFLGKTPVYTVTWGMMLAHAHTANAFNIGMQGWIILPGLCIVTVVLGFTLLGYAMDDVMNPKLRKR